jgi:hypothetical protein
MDKCWVFTNIYRDNAEKLGMKEALQVQCVIIKEIMPSNVSASFQKPRKGRTARKSETVIPSYLGNIT